MTFGRAGLSVLLVAALTNLAAAPALADSKTATVATREQLVAAVKVAPPGATILLRSGVYAGGLTFTALHGTKARPIRIAAADPKNLPVIRGGNECVHLVNPAYVHLENLVLEKARTNALNIDDGGSMKATARGIRLSGLRIRDVQGRGNHDAIKLSGVTDFVVEDCRVQNWGDGGSAIDMVGCRNGVVRRCQIRHRGPTATSTGIQCKGGTRDIRIERCHFVEAGRRSINIGGSTDLKVFRPQPPPGYEAKNIAIVGNTFVGSNAPVAFVGVDGARVELNTIYRPRRWALRILQETRAPGFVPSRNGRFVNNLVVFRSDEMRDAVNIGSGTDPGSFFFAGNWWYCQDKPAASKPELPAAERRGTYGQDPGLTQDPDGAMRLAPRSPARQIGAERYARDQDR